MAAVRHLEFSKIAVLITWPVLICDSSSHFRILRWTTNKTSRYSQKTIFNMESVRHLEFDKFLFFVRFPCSEWKSAPVYQTWSKSDNSRLRYRDKAIFKTAAVRHLEFAKIAVLVTWPISACDPSSLFQISRWSANMRRDTAKKRFSIWRPSAILDLLWRHHIASENAFYVPNFVLNFHGVRFRNFLNILYFMFQHFGLKLPISGLILTIFGEKIGKNVKIKYSNILKGTSLAQNTSNKRKAVTIHPPAPLVGEPKKTKKGMKERRKERHPKQWQTGYSPRPPTSSDQNQTLHGGWPAVCSYTCQVWSKSIKGLRRCGGSKMAIPYYFGHWLIQQLVLPYKPWTTTESNSYNATTLERGNKGKNIRLL